ncbi:MAG: hypothetical protein K2J72_00535, partial [Oscillospiraceae bacterium]|nr:hypothetical protein [Oscillospiraceae bacterium]
RSAERDQGLCPVDLATFEKVDETFPSAASPPEKPLDSLVNQHLSIKRFDNVSSIPLTFLPADTIIYVSVKNNMEDSYETILRQQGAVMAQI